MTKNIFLLTISACFLVYFLWTQLFATPPERRDVPAINIHVPNGYCGEFAIFWGDNTDPVDHPGHFLSYNYYPTVDPDAILVNLPEPYERAIVRFIYEVDDDEKFDSLLNPVLERVSVGSVGINTTTSEEGEDGKLIIIPGEEFEADKTIYRIHSLSDCLTHSNLDRFNITKHFRTLLGVNR